MCDIQEQKYAVDRLSEIYDSYWSGAYRNDEIPATLDEVMIHLSKFLDGE